jgi:hypothetical protein
MGEYPPCGWESPYSQQREYEGSRKGAALLPPAGWHLLPKIYSCLSVGESLVCVYFNEALADGVFDQLGETVQL